MVKFTENQTVDKNGQRILMKKIPKNPIYSHADISCLLLGSLDENRRLTVKIQTTLLPYGAFSFQNFTIRNLQIISILNDLSQHKKFLTLKYYNYNSLC